MTYTFIIERRTGFWIVVGLLVVMFLCFLGGVGVGVQMDLPQSEALASAETTDTVPADSQQAPGTDVSVLTERDPVSEEASGTSRSARPDVASGSPSSTTSPVDDSAPSSSASGPPPAAAASDPSLGPSSAQSSAEAPSESASIDAPYTVQLGLFSEHDNARQMASEAQEAGHTVVVRRLMKNGRPLYRVWAGQFESSAAALQKIDTFRAYASGAFVARTESR